MQTQEQMILRKGPRGGAGRAPRLTISLPKGIAEAVEAEAVRLGVSQGEALRRLLEVGLKASSLLTAR